VAIVLYDTKQRRKVPFEPVTPGRVSMYVCGPTVYDDPHLGHARSSVAFDIIRRTFEEAGFVVTYVQNITDVDDKIIARAIEEATSPFEIAERYTRVYEELMRAIGVRAPSLTPKATGHITDMVALIQRLIDAGHAYALEDGDVYFSVRSFEGYGALSGRSLDDMRAGERVEPDPRKRDPMDFALWKGAPKGWQLSWPAPWGKGRPGWHIECSAMSMRYLGDTFDIHGGGQDLVFPHHENEAAQSEAATGKTFARYWLHNGFVTINDEKMSKSLKNYMALRDVLEDNPAPAVRLMLASAHYRSPLDMSPDVAEEARAAWDRFAIFARNAADVAGEVTGAVIDEQRARFMAAMEDDFNTPIAISVLHDLISEANPLVDAGIERERVASYLETFRTLAAVLGLDPIGDWPESKRVQQMAPLVTFLLELRQEARANKDFARADQIRAALKAAGVVVEDRPQGARWYLEDPWS